MPEFKAQELRKGAKGRKLIDDVLKSRARQIRRESLRYARELAGRLFEYLFKPVLQTNNMIVYPRDSTAGACRSAETGFGGASEKDRSGVVSGSRRPDYGRRWRRQ
jgi:hypothetical protein